MATFTTSQALLQQDEGDRKRASGELLHGRLRIATVVWTTDGTQAADDTIRLVKFDHPVTIHPELCSMYTSGTISAVSSTIDVGDDPAWTSITPDPDRYADGMNAHAAGVIAFNSAAVSAATITPFTTTEGGWLTATIAAMAGAAAGDREVTFKIVYSIN